VSALIGPELQRELSHFVERISMLLINKNFAFADCIAIRAEKVIKYHGSYLRVFII
jgi:hypothetical protein